MVEGGRGKNASGGGEKTFKTYIDKRQTTVAEWVALHHIFKVYAKEISYE